jgi:hypothetical protein
MVAHTVDRAGAVHTQTSRAVVAPGPDSAQFAADSAPTRLPAAVATRRDVLDSSPALNLLLGVTVAARPNLSRGGLERVFVS